MKKYIIYLLGVVLLTISCDRPFVMSGRVVDEKTSLPIEDVEIVTSENTTTFTDSLGYFSVNIFGLGSKSDKLEVLVSKEGYETKYFDLSKVEDLQQIVLSIKPSSETLTESYPQSYVKLFYWLNLIFVNLIVLYTMRFVLFTKVRYRWIWILLFLGLNFTLRINYINGAIDFSLFHLPFYIKHYGYYPFTIKIALPLSIIAFWAMYFVKRDSIERISCRIK